MMILKTKYLKQEVWYPYGFGHLDQNLILSIELIAKTLLISKVCLCQDCMVPNGPHGPCQIPQSLTEKEKALDDQSSHNQNHHRYERTEKEDLRKV